ncbi:hypothetical protein T459_10921 [Capsicum annuum]|uniref:Uncharacterized protein n=1 Tax=Capsicum annuum TaxID=4072 RepID=A0A2G3A3L1_CAPAN|nr:hypothetical protein T459_10921 [Capsicum annuum]
MLEGKGVIEDTDMPVKMQIQAMRLASQALDVYDVLDCTSIAAHIKKFRQYLDDSWFLSMLGELMGKKEKAPWLHLTANWHGSGSFLVSGASEMLAANSICGGSNPALSENL